MLFMLSAVTIATACVAVARSRAFAANPDIAAWGITFDLAIGIPLVYWFFVVRGGHARAVTVAPLFLVGLMLASFVVPRAQQQFLGQLRLFVAPAAEVLLAIALIQRVRQMRLERSSDADPYVRISTAARALVGDTRAAEVVASEFAMLYYALFCWKEKPQDDPRAFTLHERSGWSSVVACILVLIVAESVGMHLLIALWSPIAAWIWTALDLWGMVWLIGDYHALRLRRSSIDDEMLHIRYGLRWSVSIPIASIVAIEAVQREEEWKRREVLKVAILEEPRWLITFDAPVIAHGLAGLRKEIRAIALLPDDDAPISALRHAIAARDRRAERP
jgi:hypothetical protein